VFDTVIMHGMNNIKLLLYFSPLCLPSRGDQIEKNEMGGACSTYGRKGRCIQDFGR
jgi:hypothetical protein